MTLPATDGFLTATSQTLTAYSANWAALVNNGFVDATQDAVRCNTTSADCFVRWSADAPNNNQYCQVRVAVLTGSGTAAGGPAVRMHSSQTTCYYAAIRFDTLVLWKVVNNSFTNLGSAAAPAAQGDTVRIEADGNQISVKKNGVTVIGPVTDSGIASGSAGLRLFSTNTTNGFLDDFEAGNLGGVAYTMPADSGSFALTGSAASLEYGHKLVAASGAFVLSGQDVALRIAHRLIALSGTYVLTGTDAGLLYGALTHYTMVAEASTYNLAGTAATLRYGRCVMAESGVYALSGTDIAFGQTRILLAASGVYTLTGMAATLIWSGFIQPPTPQERIFVVPYQNRTYSVPEEQRIYELV